MSRVAGGEFSYDDYEFVNFDVDEVCNDLLAFNSAIKTVNPNVNIILTVSPVPLIATATDANVLTASTYSKSVLRVAAERFVQEVPNSFYFPSFEIITGAHAKGQYFADDLRSVTEEGVEHVMRLFFEHLTEEKARLGHASKPAMIDAHTSVMKEVVAASCDEEALD